MRIGLRGFVLRVLPVRAVVHLIIVAGLAAAACRSFFKRQSLAEEGGRKIT